MPTSEECTEIFEASRAHLRAVAYRLLGSRADAEDAVQETWLRFDRAAPAELRNPPGWLTTVVTRISLDQLRARGRSGPATLTDRVDPTTDTESEVMLAEAVSAALLVVLDTLRPSERVVFVLHDLFALPFDVVAPILGRSPDASRQLATRARRRLRAGGTAAPDVGDPGEERVALVEAFLRASREGDVPGLVAVLDPDVELRSDAVAAALGSARRHPTDLRGAGAVATAFSGQARLARPAAVDDTFGLVVAPRGRILMVLRFSFRGDRIATIDAIADRGRLRSLTVTPLAVGRMVARCSGRGGC